MIDERHYSVQELAEKLSLSGNTIRRRFRHEPGVLLIGRTLRIPQSVADRVYRTLSVEPPIHLPRYVVRRLRDGAIVREPKALKPAA